MEVIASQLDKTFYGVEYVQNDTAGLPLEEYLQRKAGEANRKYRFLILVGEGECVDGLPIRLRTRLKNKLHRPSTWTWPAIRMALVWSGNAATMTGATSSGRSPSRRPRWSAASFPTPRRESCPWLTRNYAVIFTHILVTEGID